ncbi:AtpZ/AtpI family protein [Aquiflexum balticum]|uniref:AtpZ/AtpI family protein n=1 Tax=Aquiflexum balticum TaxID=280473 RepID=UPI0009FD7EA3|nr:AtpZ/AtpI family protein [Aquiflexum balticum]
MVLFSTANVRLQHPLNPWSYPNPIKVTESQKNKSPHSNAYLKYIGLSFQLFTVIGLGTWFGWYVQQKSQMKFPIWLLLFCLLSIIVAFYHLYITMKNDQKPEDEHKK